MFVLRGTQCNKLVLHTFNTISVTLLCYCPLMQVPCLTLVSSSMVLVSYYY